MSKLERALRVVLAAEGGYSNDPNDKGNWTGGVVGVGELKGTKYGVSAAQYPDINIAALTLESVSVIYRRDYWDAINGDALPWPLVLYVFDAAVNQGCDAKAGYRAQKMLQRAFKVAEDGIIGAKTVAAIQRDTIYGPARFMAYRAIHYASLPTFSIYGHGWMTRLFMVQAEGLKHGHID